MGLSRFKLGALALLGSGAGLIFYGFYLVLGPGDWSGVARLNLALCMALLCLACARLALLGMSTRQFEALIPVLGMAWLAGRAYMALVVLGMLGVWLSRAGLRVAAFIQLLALFVAGIFMLILWAAGSKGQEVAHQEAGLAAGCDALRGALAGLSAQLAGQGQAFEQARAALSALSDEARYLSPSSSVLAGELEQSLVAELAALGSRAGRNSAQSQPLLAEEMEKGLLRIQELMRQRKECRQQ